MPEMEQAGGYVARTGAVTTIKARVFSGPNGTGELLADLGTVVGPRTKAERAETEKKLKMLKDRSDKKQKGMRNNG